MLAGWSIFGKKDDVNASSPEPVEPVKKVNLEVEKIVIDQDGGSGHTSAANEQLNDGVPAVRVNTTKANWLNFEWISEKLKLKYIPYLNTALTHNYGKDGVDTWDKAQAEANTRLQNELVSKQYIANIIFAPNFYFQTMALFKEYPNTAQIVSTQQLCIAGILKAIGDWNEQQKKNVTLKVVITDLPTKYAAHFFDSLKLINPHDLQHAGLIIDVPYPAIRKGLPSIANCHEELSKLCPCLYEDGTCIPKSNIQINFTDGPIDKHFKEIKKRILAEGPEAVKKDIKSQPLPITLNNDAYKAIKETKLLEGKLIKLSSDKGITQTHFTIPQNAWVESILLGSKASVPGTIELVKQIYAFHAEIYKDNPDQERYLLVYCSENPDLFNFVLEMAKDPKYQMNGKFKIIPLTNQNKNMISRADCIADCSTIRPGGMKTMEDEAVATGDVIMFAEVDMKMDEKLLLEDPTQTLVNWEIGNSEHAEVKIGYNRVLVLNKLNYLEERLKRYNAKKKSQVMPTCLDLEILSTFENLAAVRKDYSDVVAMGVAYYIKHYTFNDLLSGKITMHEQGITFGKLYAAGCEIFLKKGLPHLQKQKDELNKHPFTWAIYFANYFINKAKIGVIPGKLENSTIYMGHIELASEFANAFYQPDIEILTENEAHLFVNDYMSALPKNKLDINLAKAETIRKWRQQKQIEDDFVHVEAKNHATTDMAFYLANRCQQYLPGFISLTNQDKIEKLQKQWNSSRESLAKKIQEALMSYIPQWGVQSALTKRKNIDKATEMLTFIQQNARNEARIIQYFLEKRDQHLVDKTIDQAGTFITTINFIYENIMPSLINQLEKAWQSSDLLVTKIQETLNVYIQPNMPFYKESQQIIEYINNHQNDDAAIIQFLNAQHNLLKNNKNTKHNEVYTAVLNFIISNIIDFEVNQSMILIPNQRPSPSLSRSYTHG